jgi:hypothetical protein
MVSRRSSSSNATGTPSGLAIEEGAFPDGRLEHLLQAERLRAELHLVGTMRLGAAALVLGRMRTPAPAAPDQLDHVRDARNPQPVGAERHAVHGAHAGTRGHRRLLSALVQQTPLGGQHVLGPRALDVDQRALSRAEQVVLQRRYRDGVVARMLSSASHRSSRSGSEKPVFSASLAET